MSDNFTITTYQNHTNKMTRDDFGPSTSFIRSSILQLGKQSNVVISTNTSNSKVIFLTNSISIPITRNSI